MNAAKPPKKNSTTPMQMRISAEGTSRSKRKWFSSSYSS